MKKGISLSKKAEIARKEHEKLLKYKSFASLAYLYIGKTLKKIRDEKLYLYIFGEGCDSFKDYLRSPEVGISQRKAYYLIEIYETFCEKLGYNPEKLRELHWTSLREIKSVVNKENADLWIENAKQLTTKDLIIRVKQEKGQLANPMTCQHEWEKITYWKCKKCLSTSRIPPPEWKE